MILVVVVLGRRNKCSELFGTEKKLHTRENDAFHVAFATTTTTTTEKHCESILWSLPTSAIYSFHIGIHKKKNRFRRI